MAIDDYADFVKQPSSLDNHDGAVVAPRGVTVIAPDATLAYPAIMTTKDVITQKLTSAFTPVSLRIEDESHRHEGHAGHRPGGETHFRVYIVSEAFRGKTRIARHRLINEILSAELADRVHALAIHASAPGENGT
jgi:BolA protein